MCVKGEGGRPFATVENDDMSSSAARRSSPIAARIRARLAELGLAERKASEAMGWTATVLSATLRRIDAGGGLNTDTLPALEKLLGKPAQWTSSRPLSGQWLTQSDRPRSGPELRMPRPAPTMAA